jgi:hypothetical protein
MVCCSADAGQGWCMQGGGGACREGVMVAPVLQALGACKGIHSQWRQLAAAKPATDDEVLVAQVRTM